MKPMTSTAEGWISDVLAWIDRLLDLHQHPTTKAVKNHVLVAMY